MPNRILKDSICTSDNLDRLTPEQEVFWYRLLVQCDDYGRMDARPAILLAKCFPLKLATITEDWIAGALQVLADVNLIRLYVASGKSLLQVVTWENHQQIRAKRSKYPPMVADDCSGNDLISDDSNGNHVIADAPVIQSNPIQKESNAPAPSLPKTTGTAAEGRKESARLKDLNREVSAELRIPIVNELLEFTGKLALAEVPNDAGSAVLSVAHEYARTLYLMGYKTAESLLPVEDAWGQSWKSKDNTRPSFKQFVEFASEQLGARGNGHAPEPQATAVY